MQLGHVTEGIALIRQGIGGRLEMGARLGLNQHTKYLAVALALEGSITDALQTIEEAIRENPRDLGSLMLRGELYLKQGLTEQAQSEFRQTLAEARRIGAKAWELRATMSLAKILASHGERKQARAMLAEIYHWFTEGFDTADLQDAKALLEELGAQDDAVWQMRNRQP